MSTPAHRLERLAGELAALAADLDTAHAGHPPHAPHPDTTDLLARKDTTRRQIHLSVPDALDLPGRLAAYRRDNGLSVGGDAAALILDTALRAAGYPPPPFARRNTR